MEQHMKFADAFAKVEALFANVKTVVQAVETDAQATGLTSGSAKYASAVSKVNATLAIAEEYNTIAGMLAPVVGPLVDAAVAWFNAKGLFTHKATPAPAAPAATSGA